MAGRNCFLRERGVEVDDWGDKRGARLILVLVGQGGDAIPTRKTKMKVDAESWVGR